MFNIDKKTGVLILLTAGLIIEMAFGIVTVFQTHSVDSTWWSDLYTASVTTVAIPVAITSLALAGAMAAFLGRHPQQGTLSRISVMSISFAVEVSVIALLAGIVDVVTGRSSLMSLATVLATCVLTVVALLVGLDRTRAYTRLSFWMAPAIAVALVIGMTGWLVSNSTLASTTRSGPNAKLNAAAEQMAGQAAQIAWCNVLISHVLPKVPQSSSPPLLPPVGNVRPTPIPPPTNSVQNDLAVVLTPLYPPWNGTTPSAGWMNASALGRLGLYTRWCRWAVGVPVKALSPQSGMTAVSVPYAVEAVYGPWHVFAQENIELVGTSASSGSGQLRAIDASLVHWLALRATPAHAQWIISPRKWTLPPITEAPLAN